jgi:hypothetical protein
VRKIFPLASPYNGAASHQRDITRRAEPLAVPLSPFSLSRFAIHASPYSPLVADGSQLVVAVGSRLVV